MKENENVVKKLTEILKQTSKHLKINGYRYMELPPVHSVDDRRFISALYPLFPHRTAATCSGLGWIGKNGMLINGHYGPNLVWSTLLTNADLVASRPQLLGMCDRCRLCVTACPVDAIKGINWSRAWGNEEIIEITTCEDYMKTNEEKFGRPVCGVCFMACPIGANITRPVLKR